MRQTQLPADPGRPGVSDTPLAIAASAALPLAILDLERRGGPGDDDYALAHFAAQAVAEKGDQLQFRTPKSKHQAGTAAVFAEFVRGMAVASFCPGGVCFAGVRYEGGAS